MQGACRGLAKAGIGGGERECRRQSARDLECEAGAGQHAISAAGCEHAGGNLVRQFGALRLETLAQPHRRLLEGREPGQHLAQRRGRRRHQHEFGGGDRGAEVSLNCELRRQRDLRQIALVAARGGDGPALPGVTSPQHHLVSGAQTDGDRRAPGAGAKYGNPHERLASARAPDSYSPQTWFARTKPVWPSRWRTLTQGPTPSSTISSATPCRA